MKIYTRTGDKGTTGLYGGSRLRKDDARIEAYGTVDELNSVIGLVRAQNEIQDDLLELIQVELFNIGSHLAIDPESDLPVPDLNSKLVERLEQAMDRMSEELPKLKSFVLPGGSIESANVHLARTICRRAERRVLTASDEHKVEEGIIVFLNRLSDYLFILARHVLRKQGREDVLWQSGV
ncbi:MAG: cob(I)yrinic acid a,c-diamide adenosyltransferase [Saprospiraceae bacterium]|nr:cob(I)yrinic acid a,c-diamide adenosyltransferase [Saprospiraceae bacterium]